MTSVFKKTPPEQLAANKKSKHSKKTKEVKHKSIIEMIEEDRGDLSLPEYAKVINYVYKNLWAVCRGNRSLPLEQTLLLCQRRKIPSDQAVRIYLSQDSKSHPVKVEASKEKKRSLLDRTPRTRED
jgi:hypothetical protein